MALNLDDIKYFTIVCENLNITRASEIIGISQPALSYSIKRIEKEFNSDLIIRSKSGVQLTKLGEEFYKKSKKLIDHWEDTTNIFTENAEDILGTFSIGIHASVAIYTLDKILPAILKEYPKIDFKLEHGLSRVMTNKVINWEVDFGFVINPIEHPDLVIKEIGKDEVTLFSTTKSLKKLIYDPALSQSDFILKKMVNSKVKTEGEILTENLEVISKLASSGLGYGLLPTRVAQEYPNLKAIKGAPAFKDRICLIYRKEKHTNIVSRNIIKIIRDIKI
jgi:DNA-binding transcriptional LysR family regulator